MPELLDTVKKMVYLSSWEIADTFYALCYYDQIAIRVCGIMRHDRPHRAGSGDGPVSHRNTVLGKMICPRV